MESELDPSSLVDTFQHLGDLKGTIGAVGLGVFLLIRLYRLPPWQASLPPWARWENLPVAGKYGLIGGLAGLGALLSAHAQGLSWQQAFSAGVAAALTAMTVHEVTSSAPARAVASVVVPPAKADPPSAP